MDNLPEPTAAIVYADTVADHEPRHVDFSEALNVLDDVEAAKATPRPVFKRADSSQAGDVPQVQVMEHGHPTGLSVQNAGFPVALTVTSTLHEVPAAHVGSFLYPPVIDQAVFVDLGHETTYLRRFRMFASFVALFLAGWK